MMVGKRCKTCCWLTRLLPSYLLRRIRFRKSSAKEFQLRLCLLQISNFLQWSHSPNFRSTSRGMKRLRFSFNEAVYAENHEAISDEIPAELLNFKDEGNVASLAPETVPQYRVVHSRTPSPVPKLLDEAKQVAVEIPDEKSSYLPADPVQPKIAQKSHEEKKENIADRCLSSIQASLDISPVQMTEMSSTTTAISELETTLQKSLLGVKNDVLQGPSAAISQKSSQVLSALSVERPWERSKSVTDVQKVMPNLSMMLGDFPLVEENFIKNFDQELKKVKQNLKDLESKAQEKQQSRQAHERWLCDPCIAEVISLQDYLGDVQFRPEEPTLTQSDLTNFKESGQWLKEAGEQYVNAHENVRVLMDQLKEALDKKMVATENFNTAVESFVVNHLEVIEKTKSSIRRILSISSDESLNSSIELVENTKKVLLKRISGLDELLRFFKRFEEIQTRLLDIDDQISNKRRDIEVAKNRKKPTDDLESQLEAIRQNSEDLRIQARLDINLQIDDCSEEEDKETLRNFFKEFLDDGDVAEEGKKDGGISNPRKVMNYPEEFLCPISYQLMNDPVMISEADDGISYERSAIEEWLKKEKTNPLTRQPISSTKLTPNRALKATIDNFKKNNV
eukprot:TRINITY_DN7471_c0_g2_i1.p1 TRINITY_DN7471_c0_g2~~TRINITY_DN7471_c0_g2_i1.p1  ORF type:complete len:622 (+),score=170.04 TRINITY_DN7471_c0_g2_i1:209-2074(+)